MDISEHKIGKITILKVSGQATMTSEPQRLSAAVEDALGEGDRLFIIDLSNCQRMDSMGLGELVKAYRLVSDKEGVVKLASVPLPLRGTISAVKLSGVLEVYDSERAAVNSFGS
jgi:anti-sigma B factor antagonist